MMSKLILSISAFFLLKSINASIGCQYQLQNIFLPLITTVYKNSLNGIETKNLHSY